MIIMALYELINIPYTYDLKTIIETKMIFMALYGLITIPLYI